MNGLVAQPFLRINSAAPCHDSRRHAPQIVPVVGNNDRQMPVFVVQHGPRHYLDHNGWVTTTPVWLTWAEATAAEQAHADSFEAGIGVNFDHAGREL